MTNTVQIVDHATGRRASGIAYQAIRDAVRGWREPLGLDWEDLDAVEITTVAA